MSKINIKIMGTDPFSKAVLVACNTEGSLKTLEEQPQLAFPPDFGGATTVAEFLFNIQATCRQTAFNQDVVETKNFDVETWVGESATYTPPVEDTTISDYLNSKQKAYAQYPSANMDSIRQLLAITFDNMQLAPLVRMENATVIGVFVNGYGGATVGEGALAMKSIKECTDLCISLGVPMCGGTSPKSGMERDRFVSYLSSISSHNKFIAIPSESYVYQDWNLLFAQNRKKTIINSERNAEIASGITFAGFEWDSDEGSRNNLTNYIAANSGGTAIWRTKDNQNISVDLVGLSKSIADHVTACFEKSWARKEALKATTSFGEVDAI